MSSVFTKIINGELPGRFVYRDDYVVAFLTIEPLTYGHVLVVPVKEVDKWTELPQEQWRMVTDVAQMIGNAIVRAFGSSRCGFIIAGFDVHHTHIHLFPTEQMSDYDFSKAIPADQTDSAQMDEAATRLRELLHTDEDGRTLS